jgi:hypothetical protein
MYNCIKMKEMLSEGLIAADTWKLNRHQLSKAKRKKNLTELR